ncbi:MAG: 5'-methylthioadenosine/S-adenosylhomocysteine nucleosidase [Ruminococcaceae bacterium]|jgi:5'-methylthioadenosine/S-adenosylhomocysteine nucleosidase|nr:5'-methylthioadenosine/S-adenosylhomocysteine nucleosidase [Oscillospiraceae bacterium]
MRIGVVCAMEDEISLLRHYLGKEKKRTNNGIGISEYIYEGHSVFLAVSGIGKVFASMATSILLSTYKCDLILNTGLAGSCDSGLMPGDSVLVNKVFFHDFDERIYEDVNKGFDSDVNLLKLSSDAVLQLGLKYKLGVCATGDVFVDDSIKKDAIITKTGCKCIEMELAAIAQACKAFSVPFVSLKVISDNADENAEGDFDIGIEKFTKISADYIMKMIELLLSD